MGGPAHQDQVQPSTSHDIPLRSESALAFLSLTRDISALISLSLEATASLVHDWYRSSLLTIGVGRGQVVRYAPPEKGATASTGRGESGRGLAVVVIGAAESTGHSLTLHLAKSGYTVFPLLALPSQSSPPTSHALSSLLLTWSSAQKRLRSRYPNHPGSIVPIMVDPEAKLASWTRDVRGKGRARFGHAGETVRASIAENGLRLVAVVCASREGMSGDVPENHAESSEDAGEGMDGDWRPRSPEEEDRREPSHQTIPPTAADGGLGISLYQHGESSTSSPPTRHLSPSSPGLLATEESALLSLYHANVLEPLAVIREFEDLLALASHPDGRRGRVVFVNRPAAAFGRGERAGEEARSVIQAARAEAARVLREEMGPMGIEVCEVAVGPMAPRLDTSGGHIRHISEDSMGGSGNDAGRTALMKGVLAAHTQRRASIASDASFNITSSSERILASRLALLAQLWAVDDALLYSSVRRAIEDRYPRAKHHAGLSPLVESVAGVVPGMGMMKVLGRWLLGKLLVPREARGV